jgi:hypothetical protein
MNEAATEAAIVAAGKTAPRITPAHIDATIIGEQYLFPEGTALTIAVLTLRNGFTVIGESAAASPENFDKEIGMRIARERAREKIWPLEGYLLREKLSQPAPDFRQRVRNEKAELEERLDKLRGFIASDRFVSLGSEERERLNRQASVMVQYKIILEERIGAFS